MANDPIQSAPNFQSNLKGTLPAQLFYVKAKQAYAEKQWQQACNFAQMCISGAQNDDKIRFLAKELMAASLLELGRHDQALQIFSELQALTPNDAILTYNAGLALMHLCRYEEAITSFLRAVELNPENIEFRINLGLAYYKNNDFAQAKAVYVKASHIAPNHVKAKYGIAGVLEAEGYLDEAMVAYEQVLLIDPFHVQTLSNLIFIHHYLSAFNFERHNNLLRRFRTAVGNVKAHRNMSQKLKVHSPLRIGFVSADLLEHPVGYFLDSTIEQLSLDPSLRSHLILVAYANQAKNTQFTQQLRNRFDLWRRVDEWDDDIFIEQIKKDQIDILIDLSGHTVGGRLSVFAKKPAPVQVSWIGYWGSTGLSSIDYVLADPVTVPVDEEQWFVEKIWRPPSLRYCFSIPKLAPEVSPAPFIKNEFITFGCYQNSIKIKDEVLGCWTIILKVCPTARLRVQSRGFGIFETKIKFIERMSLAGLDIARVDVLEGVEMEEYLTSYSEVDILLDTFPFPGGTTTAQALWMGVPTLTQAKPGMLGRQGEALLVNAGLSDWVAHSEEEYVEKAITWGSAGAQQRQALATLRAELREQVRQSPVFDAKQFAQDFVDAMYGMWREKCDGDAKRSST
jgi:protein O-GlcNAc transferase